MKKKGFTLVEIIVCIGIVAILGVASFVGVRFVSNTIKENKLERIEDKIMLAAEVYIETNEEVKEKVYDEGVIIPLNVLHNEGLINLDGIIDKNDDDYVVALLGGGTPGEECESTYTAGSWEIGSKTIYICTKNDGSGESNIKIINPETMSNLNKALREPYYYSGYDAHNYAKFKKNNSTYLDLRIFSVDIDDSLTVVNESIDATKCKWDNYFNQNMSFTTIGGEKEKRYYRVRNSCNNSCTKSWVYYPNQLSNDTNPICGGNYLPKNMISKTFGHGSGHGSGDGHGVIYYYTNSKSSEYPFDSWLFTFEGHITTNDYASGDSFLKEKTIENEYLHLKPCIKITSGTGAEDNPYILEQKGTC